MSKEPISLNACITGVGSLPFPDSQQAIEIIGEYCPEIPFWPQLPQRSHQEMMIWQSMHAFHNYFSDPSPECISFEIKSGLEDEFLSALKTSGGALSQHVAKSFFDFKTALDCGRFSKARFLKTQTTGPATLLSVMSQATIKQMQPKMMFEGLIAHVYAQVLWQYQQLKSYETPLIFILDEPALGYLKIHQSVFNDIVNAYEAFQKKLQALGIYVGVHCCAREGFETMFRLNPEIISFDAHRDLEACLNPPAFHKFAENGGALLLGCASTDAYVLKTQNPERVFQTLRSHQKLKPFFEEQYRRIGFTSSCGLGLAQTQDVRPSFEFLRQVSALARQAVG